MISFLALLARPALACGGLFHEETLSAESDSQQALFEVGDGQVTVSYLVSYDGTAEDFGWVVPIPGAFVSLVDGDQSRFTELYELTQPTYVYDEDDDGGGPSCGCTENAIKGGLGETGGANGLDIVAEGFAGPYEYTVIEATSSDALLSWLEENGWSVGPAQPSIEAYVADGTWQFVAIGLRPDAAETPDEGRYLPPIDIAYEGDDVIFPSRMVRYSAPPEIRTIVWVAADGQYQLSDGWSQTTMEDLEGDYEADPLDVYQDALREIGGDTAGYALIWSGQWADATGADRWVTRFDTLADTSVHEADAAFGPTSADEWHEVTIYLRETPTSAAGWLLLPLVGLGWGLRRRLAL